MANSPTMCQIFVSTTLDPVRSQFPEIRCLHYMDDNLLAARKESVLQEAYAVLADNLKKKGLSIASEKVQHGEIISYLGSKITHNHVVPQKVELRKDHLHTLNDFQKLMGDINWIRGSLKMTNYELRPLYDILSGDAALDSPRELTDEARLMLSILEERLAQTYLKRVDITKEVILCILPTKLQATGLLWQDGPLLWIHPRISPGKAIEYYPIAIAILLCRAFKLAYNILEPCRIN